MPSKKNYDLTTLYFPDRVMEKLQLIKSYPLTILEAPSGFGKTTAVREFFREFISVSIPVYWHTFWGESFPVSWKNLCEIFSRVDSESADKLLELGTPDKDSLPLITEVLENMECLDETYIILDNFQDMKITFAVKLLEAFAKQGGKNLHVVIITQQLSMEGTLVVGQNHCIYKVSPQDLTFRKTDVQSYYQQAGLRITPEQLDSVYVRSNGWIAALYLQMMAFVQTGSFESGDMEQLIHTAMWGKLSEEQQNVLMTISIFQSFTLSQSEFMTGVPAELTGVMLRKNPFIRFDRETHHYHMHSILKNYLSHIFDNKQSEVRKAIYIQAGDWFAKSVSYVNALRFYHLADAPDVYEKCFALPLTSLDVADNSVSDDVRPIIFDLIDKTDYATKLRYPQSIINVAFALFFLGEHERLMRMQSEISDIIDNCTVPEKHKDVLRGEMELLMSFLEYNKIDKMSEKHRKALDLIGGATSVINNKSTWTFGSPSILYMFYRKSGKLTEELAQMDECMPYYYQLAAGHGSGAEIVMHAEAQFNRGNLDAAETMCHKALFVSDSKKQNSIYQCGLLLLARIAVMRGDLEGMHGAMQSLQERAKLNREDLCRHTLDLCEGFIGITFSEAETIPSWLSQGKIAQKALSMMVVPFTCIIYGRVLLEQKEFLKLIGTSEYFMGISSIFPNILPQLYMKIYLSQANAALGKDEAAAALLVDALETALPDKMYMPFAENGEGLKKLMPRVAAHIADKEGLAKIEELTRNFLKAVAKMKADMPTLSEREREVAQLAVQGLSNKQIAENLYLSLGTVKTLMGRVFQKLDIQSRVQLQERKF